MPNIPGLPRKEKSMAEKTDAQKRAQKTYMEKFAVARVRMEHNQYDRVQAHAEARSESVNGFINRAIQETMERDGSRMPSETAQRGLEGPRRAGVVSLPSETLEAAQRAAESAGEALPDFVARAVETQAQRDIAALRLGINPVSGGKLEREV